MTEQIKNKLEAVGRYVTKLGYHPIYVALYGSQNYGLDVFNEEYQSDFDFKAIVLPRLRDLVNDSKPVSTVEDFEGGHIDIKDIRAYMDTAMKLNPAYIEIMATENYIMLDEGQTYMPLMRSGLPNLLLGMAPLFVKAAYGMFLEKEKAMCHPYPTTSWKIEKYGYDGKQVHHMYRLLLMLRHFNETYEVSLFPPEKERNFLIDLKLNHYTLEQVLPMIEGWKQEMNMLRQRLEEAFPKIDPFWKNTMIEYSRNMIYDCCVAEVLQNDEPVQS